MRYYQIMVLVMALLFLSACCCCHCDCDEDDEKNENTNVVNSTSIPMIVGKSYTLKEGDVIIRNVESTTLLLETDMITGETVATLQQGSANITSTQ